MTDWKHGWYSGDEKAMYDCYRAKDELDDEDLERISWGICLPLHTEDDVEKLDPSAFWATLLEHAPEVAKALADAAPRAGVTDG